MLRVSRRRFGRYAGAAFATLAAPTVLRAKTRPRVVVIGGGAGGGTAAHFIAKDSSGAIEVVLIEADRRHATCIFSNLHLGGFRSFESITHGYQHLSANHGVTVVNARATAVDRAAKRVTLADGSDLTYDRLVVAPGIDLIWDSVPGYSKAASEIMPHAWQAGPQTQLLKARLDAIENGQQIVVVPPPNPYRCPPAPYERASMMAHRLKAKGFGASRIIILDPKPKFSKQALFAEGWEKHYPGMIEWYGPDVHGGIKGVDPTTGTVATDFDDFTGTLVNVIPAQRAAAVAVDAGLTNSTGFCPIDPNSMRSTLDDAVFVIGDACIAGDMPKSGFAANSQAKVVALAIVGDLSGTAAPPTRYASACWSLIAAGDGVKVAGEYGPNGTTIAATSETISHTDEPAAIRQANYTDSVVWYDRISAEMFGR
ncbi:putative flavocytochrome C sulfide dehydrogenase, flavoprotein subunit [alpha proteobacterium BAL199]|jgi:sulfide dehydrogenase [flavocytochrome c] flavoprotein chain|nr:putative flavocytochrome C sulfide dehydrogenase, flavoprotein subunit [alpha proteobacterium BAL199]